MGGGEGEGEGEGEKTEEELKAEEELMKKFEPFTYVSEQNLKGLAYLLRKEEPWIIALVAVGIAKKDWASRQGEKGFTKAPNGTIVAAYKIESHFDIRRSYNPTTGEQLNIIEENTSDRPWYDRQFMRVDWSSPAQQVARFGGFWL